MKQKFTCELTLPEKEVEKKKIKLVKGKDVAKSM